MLYEEFLRKGGFSREEVTLKMYAKIEKLYMERDDLFPDQESVIEYFKTAGIYGFTPRFVAAIDAVRQAVTNLNQIAIGNCFEPLLKLALASAELPPRLK